MKTYIQRFLLGSLMGIGIGHFIALLISSYKGQGAFLAASPDLVSSCGSELAAVWAQTLGCMLLGGAYTAASVVFGQEGWSLARQTLVHLILTAPVQLGVGYWMFWWRLDDLGWFVLLYLGIYLVIWLAYYLYWKMEILRLNREIQKKN